MGKNLTFKDTINGIEGIFVDVSSDIRSNPENVYHHIVEQHDTYPWPPFNHTCSKPRQVIKGPAIDRLHEFEKLGMEPEEIKKLKLENVDLIRKHYDDRQVKEHYDALVKSTNDLNERYKSLEARNIALENRNKKLEEENRELRSEIEMDDQLFKSKSQIITKLNGQKIGLKEELEAKNKKIQNFEISMEQLVDHIRTLESKDWCKVAKEQEAKINELESENMKLQALADQRDLYMELHAHSEENVMKLNNQLKYTQALYDNVKESAHNELRTARERDEWKHKYNHIFEHNNILMREVSKLKDKLEKAQKHIVKWKNAANGDVVSKLESELMLAQKHIADLRRSYKLDGTEIRELKALNKDLMKINDEQYERVNELATKNYDLSVENEDLKKRNKKWEEDYYALKNWHSTQLNAIYGARPDIVENLKDQIERLNKNNEERQKTIDELSLRLDASRRANDFLKVERDNFKAKNEQLSNELAHAEARLNKCSSDKKFIDATYRTAIKCEIEERKKLETENKDLKAKMETINYLSDLRTGKLDDIATTGPRH